MTMPIFKQSNDICSFLLQGRLNAFKGGTGSGVDMTSNQNDLRFLPYAQKFAFFFRMAFFLKTFAELYDKKI